MNFLILLSLFSTTYCTKIINLDENNLVVIKGVINQDTSNKFFNDLKDFNDNSLDIFISSPGGSVMEGMKMIDYINTLKKCNIVINCYGDFAASMAFVILQSCTNRYALESSILMQHQMSLGLSGPIENIKSYFKMIQDIENKLNLDQANRVGLKLEEFEKKIFNDWWISGITATNENVIDQLVDLKCSNSLLKKRTSLEVKTFFGIIKYTFSKCPLLRNPLDTDLTKYDGHITEEINKFDFEYFVKNIKSF